MFYSQCLMSRKGPLEAIWVAAYCFKRLKKRDIASTHIPSSVDKILLEGLPCVTYRVLAYLLLGVVKIYSKKVELLFEDCHEAVTEINRFSTSKKATPFRDIIRRSYSSVIRPERFELDTFQLDFTEDINGCIVAQHGDLILQEAGKDGYSKYCLDKHFHEEDTALRESASASHLAIEAYQSHETWSSTKTPVEVVSDHEPLSIVHTPPDKILPAHRMEIDKEVTTAHLIRNLSMPSSEVQNDNVDYNDFIEKTTSENYDLVRSEEKVAASSTVDGSPEGSLEMLRASLSTEECLEIEMFCPPDVELLDLFNCTSNDEVRNFDFVKEMQSDYNGHLRSEDKAVTPTIDVTPNVTLSDVAGVATPETLAVRTPGIQESVQRPRKRKCLFNDIIVLSNEVLRRSIDDSSDLVYKRRKAPHTIIDLWRFSRIPNLSHNLLEPAIPCAAAVELGGFCYAKTSDKDEPTVTKEVEPVCIAEPEPVESTERGPSETEVAPEKPGVASPRSPTAMIAPGTPVCHPTSARIFGSPKVADSDGDGPLHLFENGKKDLSAHKDDLSPSLLEEEMDANEGDSQEQNKEMFDWSARTRSVARYLHRSFTNKKQQNNKATLTLFDIVDRKTKKEAARLFYEILVLKSGSYVDVMQEKAYDDIVIEGTLKMEAILGN